MVSVLFEDNTWHTGHVDAYNPKNFKVRIVFQDLRIGAFPLSKLIHKNAVDTAFLPQKTGSPPP